MRPGETLIPMRLGFVWECQWRCLLTRFELVPFVLGGLFLVIGWLVFQSITEIMNDCCCVFVEILHLGFEVLVFVSGVCIEKLRF